MNLPRSSNHPIVCIPHAGAGGSAFQSWQRKIGSSLFAVTLPGRDATSAQLRLRSISDMATYVAGELCMRGLRAITLFGHSMGALVAYETTRRLQQEQPGVVRRLVVSGCRSPTAPSSLRLSAIPDDTIFLKAVAELGGLPAEVTVNPTVVDYILPILRADIGAADAYHHEAGEALRVPLTALGGDDDPFVSLQALAAWHDVAAGGFEQVVMRGGHFFIFEHIDHVLRVLRA